MHVTKESHDTLHCVWHPPETDLQNGPITRYEVRYVKSAKEDEKPNIKYQMINETFVTLRSLEAGASYEISVRAYTKIGPGPFLHPPIMIFTGEGIVNIVDFIEGQYKIINGDIHPLSANPTRWSNTLKQFAGKLQTNCFSEFDHFVEFALKGLRIFHVFLILKT